MRWKYANFSILSVDMQWRELGERRLRALHRPKVIFNSLSCVAARRWPVLIIIDPFGVIPLEIRKSVTGSRADGAAPRRALSIFSTTWFIFASLVDGIPSFLPSLLVT